MDFKSLIAAIAAFFSVAPIVDQQLLQEQAKADTAALVTYAALADGVLVAEAPKARCLVFYFDGCPPCEQLHRTIDKDLVPNGWSAGKQGDDFEFIDVKGKDPRATTYRRNNRWQCPTMVIIDSKGKELDRHVGVLRAKQLAEWIGKYRQ